MAFTPWQPGMRLTVDRLEAISAKPVAYTPTFGVASGTAPSYGTGSTIRAYYYRIGRLIRFNVHLKFGTGATFGSGGAWRFGLPVPMAAAAYRANVDIQALDVSAGVFRGGLAIAAQSQPVGQEINIIYTDGLSVWNNAQPFAWAVGDELFMGGMYEAA